MGWLTKSDSQIIAMIEVSRRTGYPPGTQLPLLINNPPELKAVVEDLQDDYRSFWRRLGKSHIESVEDAAEQLKHRAACSGPVDEVKEFLATLTSNLRQEDSEFDPNGQLYRSFSLLKNKIDPSVREFNQVINSIDRMLALALAPFNPGHQAVASSQPDLNQSNAKSETKPATTAVGQASSANQEKPEPKVSSNLTKAREEWSIQDNPFDDETSLAKDGSMQAGVRKLNNKR